MVQSITFRLHDSLPSEMLRLNFSEVRLTPAEFSRSKRLHERRIRHCEDKGQGACWLSIPRIAQITEEALLYFDTQRYRLLAWCIMPNHVHALIETVSEYSLNSVVQSWKSFTAKEANRLLKRKGRFWDRDFHDRFIRSHEHFTVVVRYIEDNPVKAGLVGRATDWPWSSAKYRDY